MTMRPEADPNLAVEAEVAPVGDAGGASSVRGGERVIPAPERDATRDPARPRTLRRDVWRRVRGDRIALVSLAVLAVYVLIALVALTGAMSSDGARWGNLIEDTVGEANHAPSFTDPDGGGVSPAFWVGTDYLGRSVFWRFLYGSRVALTVGVLASVLSITIGTTLGLIAGYKGGIVDSLVIWLFSTVSSVPGILLILALAFVLKGVDVPFVTDSTGQPVPLTGIPVIVIALGLTSWIGLCRYVRGEVLKLRDRDYVAAARAVGLGDTRILLRHVLPNVMHLVIIDFSLGLGAFVQAEVVLSFLGLGVTDQPSWGRMIDDAKLELLKGVWWQMAAATLAIFVFSLAVNLLGDALRDALDPKLRGAD